MRRRRTGRRDPRQAIIACALLGLAILGTLGYLALTAENGLPLVRYYYLDARFANASELSEYSDVRIAGVLVGQVLGTSWRHDAAVVRLQLRAGAGPLRSSTTARIRLQGVLGAEYVELTPGRTGAFLHSGATLPASQTSTTVDVFDVLDMFDPRTRTSLREVLDGLGQGFLGQGASLNQELSELPGVVSQFGQIATAVDDRPGAAAHLIPGAQSLAAAFEPVRVQLAAGFAPGATALSAWVRERPHVQTALREAAADLPGIRTGLAETDPLLSATAGLSDELVRLTRPAPAALWEATALLRAAPSPLRHTQSLLDGVSQAVPGTLRTLDALAPLAAPTTRTLGNTIPWLAELSRYGCDVTSWAGDWYRLFDYGTPPTTSAGLAGYTRVAAVLNAYSTDGNVPGGVPAAFYPAPCTVNDQKLK